MTESVIVNDSPISSIHTGIHFGKVQFLRLEHGYIRSKVKMNGIRDITFYYKDLDEALKDILILGSLVSFVVDQDERGKLIAKSIKLTELPKDVPAQDSGSVQTEKTSDSIFSDDDCSGTSSNNIILRTPATMQLFLQNQKDLSCEIKYPFADFDKRVNIFLEKVMSHDYDSSRTSCWLY